MPFALPLPDLPWYALAAVPLIVLAAYTVFGATGFGSSLIAVPLLAHLVPLTFAVPLITALDAGGATTQSVRHWRDAAWPEFRRLLPFMLVGIALGTTLLVTLPRAPALLALGVFVARTARTSCSGARTLRRAPGWLVVPIGLVGGVFSVTLRHRWPGVHGVPVRAHPRQVGAARDVVGRRDGQRVDPHRGVPGDRTAAAQPPLLTVALLMVPVMIVGLVIGNRLHHALTGGGFMRLLALLFLINGISLVARALPWLTGG